MWRTVWFVMYNHWLCVKLGIYRVVMLMEEVHQEMGLCPIGEGGRMGFPF